MTKCERHILCKCLLFIQKYARHLTKLNASSQINIYKSSKLPTVQISRFLLKQRYGMYECLILCTALTQQSL